MRNAARAAVTMAVGGWSSAGTLSCAGAAAADLSSVLMLFSAVGAGEELLGAGVTVDGDVAGAEAGETGVDPEVVATGAGSALTGGGFEPAQAMPKSSAGISALPSTNGRMIPDVCGPTLRRF